MDLGKWMQVQFGSVENGDRRAGFGFGKFGFLQTLPNDTIQVWWLCGQLVPGVHTRLSSQ
jgi:hypothetical protein